MPFKIILPLLLACLLLAFNASAANSPYADLQILALEKNGRPVPLRLTLGQFANYLASHKAKISLLVADNDLLELIVADPRMNLQQQLIHTYVFEVDPQKNTALCNHFLQNGEEVRGEKFYVNTSFLFRLVAGEAHKYPVDYKFKILNQIPEQNYGTGSFYDPDKAEAEICGTVLLNLPINENMAFLLLDTQPKPEPYFYLRYSCAIQSPAICTRLLQKVKANQQMKANGIYLNELNFIHQCRPAGK